MIIICINDKLYYLFYDYNTTAVLTALARAMTPPVTPKTLLRPYFMYTRSFSVSPPMVVE